ncbi:hypothetical protein K466DRAFT_604232 [Polyporus arcularius HHB13444]|uniref:Uncharacterized protein n=1 Tax=Polyporus arcularius HHB13444 TaxID=1314778 RepID=A0A5C3NWV9_9APHY|nr:hypothetical protein K466DRAFT_604232 [Polyporus arcularius HHB13444]
MSDLSDDDGGVTVVGDGAIAVVDDDDAILVDDDPPIVVVEDDELLLPVMDGDVPVAPADDEAILLDVWVNDRALRSIRRYVKQRDPEEGIFALSQLRLEECEWLPDFTLGFDGQPAKIRSVGTVCSTGFHADVHRCPEFAFAIDLARPVDKDALANIYALCEPYREAPPYFETFKRMRHRCASFVDVYKATKGIRSASASTRMPFTCVMVGDVVLVEATMRSLPHGLEFELAKIYLVAQAPIEID